MSQQLISRSRDLRRLRDDGYDIEIRSSHLLVKGVPYVNSAGQIKYGTLVSELTLAGDVTTTPGTHVAYFAGGHPCDKNGAELHKIKHGSARQVLAPGLEVDHSFSSKPLSGRYEDYYEKVTTYVAIISSPARALDPDVTAQTYPVVEPEQGESVFNYIDTASSRAGIGAVTRKLEQDRVAIVGLGGTGSYVLEVLLRLRGRSFHAALPDGLETDFRRPVDFAPPFHRKLEFRLPVSLPPDAQKDDRGLVVPPLERGLIWFHEYDPRQVIDEPEQDNFSQAIPATVPHLVWQFWCVLKGCSIV